MLPKYELTVQSVTGYQLFSRGRISHEYSQRGRERILKTCYRYSRSTHRPIKRVIRFKSHLGSVEWWAAFHVGSSLGFVWYQIVPLTEISCLEIEVLFASTK